MKQQIIDLIKNIPNLSKAYLFGSRANGTFREDSDYDICIVISNENKEIVYKTITEYMISNKDFIQPLVLTKSEFKEKMKLQIYKTEIIKNGKIIK